MAMIRPETEMKDTGIEWIGNIPSSWVCCKQKYVISLINGRAFKDTEFEEDGKYRILRVGNFFSNPKWYSSNLELEDDKYCYNGDLLYAWSMSYGPYIWNGEKVIYHYHIWKAKLLNNLSKRFAYYYLIALSDSIKSDVHETTMSFITMKSMNNSYIAFPEDIFEQQAIADYLDETCSKIDEIIAEAKASIDEHKELKQSVIFEAVTKGLDKDVEMKNSEVEGMGFIPKKWSVVRFMKVNYVRARLGWKGLKAEEYVDVGYPFLAAYHIVNNHLCWESLNCITKERYDESPEIKLSIGDLVLVKDGAGIGKCARIDEMPLGEATVNSSLSVITPNKLLDYRYEYYYFMSPLFQNIIARLKNGMGVPHLTQESMKDIYLPLPSKKEQRAIADYLDNKVVELDSLITEKESLINDLEAYKKSMIYEVVTGKRRVV